MKSVQEARQQHRDDFVQRLHRKYPDPDCSVRRQCEPLLDKWWPGTRESTPNPSKEEAVR